MGKRARRRAREASKLFSSIKVADNGCLRVEGDSNDCVPRSIATVTGIPYQEVHEFFASKELRETGEGVVMHPTNFRMTINGKRFAFTWTKLPKPKPFLLVEQLQGRGKYIVNCQNGKHVFAVIDGTIHDDGDENWLPVMAMSFVDGYWKLESM